EGCDRGLSGEMLRSLRQLLQKMHFNPAVCTLFDESRRGVSDTGAALVKQRANCWIEMHFL
ncbi:hypothetical protein QCD79_32500, partial [Pseudomonas quasicaspiana]|nr:hypothetical protein [Pseudomonas quasicaspiana]